MTVFPNPVSSLQELTIHFRQPLNGALKVCFYNQEGREVYKEWLRDAQGITTYHLKLYHITRGKYLLKVQNAGNEGIQKLIVE